MFATSIGRFRILGYFSRIFARRSDSARDLTAKVRRSQGEAFKALRLAYKTFNRAGTRDHSKALAKQIVKVAFQETARPGMDGVEKTVQVINAVLSNWIRDGKRNTLEEDIRVELNVQIRVHLNDLIVENKVDKFKKLLLHVQGESAEPLTTRTLWEKKRLQSEKLSPSLQELRQQKEWIEIQLEDVQRSIAKLEKVSNPEKMTAMPLSLEGNPQDAKVAWCAGWNLCDDRERMQIQYNRAQRALREELRPREVEMLLKKSEYDSELNELYSEINCYDLDTISAEAKEILNVAYKRRVAVTPEQLVPDALPDGSKELFIRVIKNLYDHS